MLCVTVQLHEQLTLDLPDGRTGTIEVDRVGSGGIRLAMQLPRDVRVTRASARRKAPAVLAAAATPTAADHAKRVEALAAASGAASPAHHGTRGPVVVSRGRAES